MEIIAGLAVIIVIFTTFYRLIKNFSNNMSSLVVIKKIAKNPYYADKIAQKLDFFYGKVSFDENKELFKKLQFVSDNQIINNYKILKIFKVDDKTLLFIAKCTDIGYNVTITGKGYNEKNVIQMYFKVVKNSNKSQYEFYSDLFNNLNDKNLKSGFINIVNSLAK
jgi:hypothetical protein